MRRFSVVVALALAGCAAYGPSPSPRQQPSQEAESDLRLQRELEQELSGPAAQSTPRDCARACDLSSRICFLADRICALAEGQPAQDLSHAQCRDGRARCQRARALVKSRCGC